MNEYINSNHVIERIDLAMCVSAGTGSEMHKNRMSHGLALICGAVNGITFSDGTSFSVRENDIVYLPKGSTYRTISRKNGYTYCINYQSADDKKFSPFVLNVKNTNEILRAYQSAEKVWRKMSEGREYLVISELYKILYELKRQQAVPYLPKTKQNLIKPAIDYIHKNYASELINVENLSELCGISYDYLRKLFKKIYDCSPIKYINDLKIKRAKELLSSRLYSVSETAYLSGFSDLSHFSRFFKENVGVNPSEYINEKG